MKATLKENRIKVIAACLGGIDPFSVNGLAGLYEVWRQQLVASGLTPEEAALDMERWDAWARKRRIYAEHKNRADLALQQYGLKRRTHLHGLVARSADGDGCFKLIVYGGPQPVAFRCKLASTSAALYGFVVQGARFAGYVVTLEQGLFTVDLLGVVPAESTEMVIVG